MKNEIIKEYAVEKKFKVLGFNDDECNCDICGRTELKGTYAIEDLSTGEIFRAGSVCGANMAGWTTRQLVAEYKAEEKEKLNKAKSELIETSEYKAHISAHDFLNRERSELHKKIFNCTDDLLRIEIKSTERTFKSRMEYLMPFYENLEKKESELKSKYGLSENTRLR
jgi:hypothetical protein